MSLFFKECKKVIFSVTFLLYAVVVPVFYFTQYCSDNEPLSKPLPGLEDYGTEEKEVPEVLMPNAIEGLVNEYLSGSFTAYPFGFYKNVKLNEKKSKELCGIIYELSGITKEQLDNFADYDEGGSYNAVPDGNGGYTLSVTEPVLPEIVIPETLTYEHFRELMRQADKIIGGGSKYSDDFIVGNFSQVPRTYEDALAEYEKIFTEEKITPAYARLFCDYAGIIISVMPVFAAAELSSKDKKSRMEQLIYSRNISSLRLVLTRYAALVSVMLIPILFTVIHAHIGVAKMYGEYEIDSLAFFKYSAVWLLPNLLLSSALGMLLTEIFSSLFAVFVQGAWWFGSVFSSAGRLTGGITDFVLVPRHNSLFGADLFDATIRQFTFNRIFYTVLALLFAAAAVIAYEIKRRGSLNVSFKNGKDHTDKSAA